MPRPSLLHTRTPSPPPVHPPSLAYLWDVPAHRVAWRSVAAAEAGPQQAYGRFMHFLDTDAIYLLDDAMARLAKLGEAERARAEGGSWAALPPAAREEREAAARQDAGAAAGHLDLAYACVDTLVFTTADPATAAPWLAPAMLDRVASTLNYFMKALAGAQKGVELDGKGVGLGGHGRKGVEMGGIGEGSGGRTQVGGARGQPPTRPPSDRSPRPV